MGAPAGRVLLLALASRALVLGAMLLADWCFADLDSSARLQGLPCALAGGGGSSPAAATGGNAAAQQSLLLLASAAQCAPSEQSDVHTPAVNLPACCAICLQPAARPASRHWQCGTQSILHVWHSVAMKPTKLMRSSLEYLL